MKVNQFLSKALFPIILTGMIAYYFITPVQANEPVIQVEEIELNKPSNAEKAEQLWDETKQKTGAAASAAAEFSKVQGTRALEAGKQGLAKGSDIVTTQSKKAWEATKEVTHTVVDYSTEKATQAGKAISEALKNNNADAPITDKSISPDEGN